MILKTKGIVLRNVKYSETSIIVDIYTEAKGLNSYIVSGVRTPKSKISAGILQVMSLVELVCYDSGDNKKLNRIKEIKAAHIYTSLPFDVKKSSIGLFMAEVIRRTIKETEENPTLFGFLYSIFQYLDETSENFVNLHLIFLVQLSAHFGFQPHQDTYTDGSVFDLKEGVFTTETIGHTYFLNENLSKILRGVLITDWHNTHLLKITREERRQLLLELVHYYRLHIDNLPEINALKILQEIF
jgi:DNA repair protein RecO (recombination protein O)